MTDYDPATPRHVVAGHIVRRLRSIKRSDLSPQGREMIDCMVELAQLLAADKPPVPQPTVPEYDTPQPLLDLISETAMRRYLAPKPEGTRVVLDLSDAGINRWLITMGYDPDTRVLARQFARALRDYGTVDPNG